MASVASLSRPCLITSREANEASGLHTCGRPCAFEEKKSWTKKHEKNAAPRNPQQPGDGDHLETVRDETSDALAHTRLLP